MTNIAPLLLVEDNHDDYEATLRSLKSSHCANKIYRCEDGQDAIDFLQRKGKYTELTINDIPSLILLDLNLPGIDGKEVLKFIKSDDNLKTIPVIVLTTSSDTRDVEQCYKLGASTYIQKPVSFQGLAEAIKAMQDYWFDIAILPPKPRDM